MACSGPPCDCSGDEPMLQVSLIAALSASSGSAAMRSTQAREPRFLVAGVAALEQQRDALRRDAAGDVARLQLFLDPAGERIERFLRRDGPALAFDVIETVRREVGHGAQACLQRLRRARLG